jgi:hypothetical protein
VLFKPFRKFTDLRLRNQSWWQAWLNYRAQLLHDKELGSAAPEPAPHQMLSMAILTTIDNIARRSRGEADQRKLAKKRELCAYELAGEDLDLPADAYADEDRVDPNEPATFLPADELYRLYEEEGCDSDDDDNANNFAHVVKAAVDMSGGVPLPSTQIDFAGAMVPLTASQRSARHNLDNMRDFYRNYANGAGPNDGETKAEKEWRSAMEAFLGETNYDKKRELAAKLPHPGPILAWSCFNFIFISMCVCCHVGSTRPSPRVTSSFTTPWSSWTSGKNTPSSSWFVICSWSWPVRDSCTKSRSLTSGSPRMNHRRRTLNSYCSTSRASLARASLGWCEHFGFWCRRMD